MKAQLSIASAIIVAALGTAAMSIPAHALTTKECSAKYQAAKKAGTLNGMKWNDFRKAECGAEATAAPAAAPAAAPPPKPAAKREATPAPMPSGRVVFPSAVSSKYSSESAGRARMHTCRDQYEANKASGGNGGLRWIQKGGGYYSECNKHLKS